MLKRLMLIGMFLAPAAYGEALRIPLAQSEAFEGRTLAWPVATAAPIPEGALKAPVAGRLVDDQGRSVPAQIEPSGWWRASDSVQWVRVRYVAEPGRQYTLELGPGLEPAIPGAPGVPGVRVDQGGQV